MEIRLITDLNLTIKKLKDVMSHTSTLSEMFNNVVLFAQACESEYKHSTFTEEFKVTKSSSHHSIDGFPEVKAVCTKYASNIISEQMKLATTVDYVFTQREGVVEVIVHIVTPGDHSSCSCAF